jgi:hypothetical protein
MLILAWMAEPICGGPRIAERDAGYLLAICFVGMTDSGQGDVTLAV